MIIRILLWAVLLAVQWMTWRRWRQSAIRLVEAVAWSVVWIASAVVVADPNITSRIARAVGVGRGADLVLYAAVLALLVLVFHLHVAHRRLERLLTHIVETNALETFKKERQS